MGEDVNQGKPKIAVIAVHGVADQSAHDSARAIANLLLNHNRSENQVQYTPFDESTLRIGVRPVMLAQEQPELEPSPKHNPLPAEHTHNNSHKLGSEPNHKESSPQIEDTLEQNAHDFMRKQLHQYKGDGVRSTYETVRLESSRLGQGNEPRPDVHIYEMYWADLSRLGTGFVRLLGEFYQLLFHLSSLGVHAVESARIEYQNPSWNWYCKLQAGAGAMLSVFIPIANLYLLLTAPITLPGNIPAPYLPIIAWCSVAIISAALTAYCLFWPKPKTPFWLWAIPPVLLALGVIGLGYSLLKGSFNPWMPLGYYRFLAFEWCALSAGIIWLLMSQYARRSPSADKVALFIGIFLAGMITKLLLSAQDSHQGITDAAFKMVEVVYIGLVSCWAMFFVLQIAAALLGCIAVWQSTAKQPNLKNPADKQNEGCRERAKRAAWTARLTLAVPSALFIVVTLTLVGALDRVGSRLLPKENFYTPRFLFADQSQVLFSGPDFIHQLIIAAASPAFVVVLGGILLTVVIAVWSLFPVAWAEVRSPKSEDTVSEQFGEWLTNGFNLMHGWGNCFVVCMAIVFPLGYLYYLLNPQIASYSWVTEEILGIFATFLVASTTSLLALRGRLDKLMLGFRSVLDIILDVDNYMRVHPLDDNPSARIYSRYVSLLRYLCNWKDPQDSQGYDALVIVAHSQGTVITADLLRFLKREADPALDRLVKGELPIYFFTMGCPLRQLYGVSFPHLYNWARHYDTSDWKPGNPQYIRSQQKPEPTKLLGVTRWINTFRSGDYIGRYLWRSDCCQYQWFRPAAPDNQDNQDMTWSSDRDRPVHVSEDKEHTRREFCLGAGAHTHYWDGTSDEVAAEIDILIREACSERATSQPILPSLH
ncbi:hypothetical protein [Allocoleopsis sp.]|uniref:hypothetical protein n=1 Tax=Allocoleopsis sp. TaxID=3088169 RepID=UPI002FD02BEA